MKKASTILSLIFIAAIGGIAAAGGCSSSDNNNTDGGGVTEGTPLVPSATGFFGGDVAGITGAWYSYGDWYNPVAGMGDCATATFTEAQCSNIVTPVPGMPFAPDASGKMCTTGTAAKVVGIGTGAPNYSAIWGAGIGFDLNNGGTDDGGTGIKGTWDADLNNVKGFSFDISGVPLGGNLRVEFPTTGTETNAAYWKGMANNLSPITGDGSYTILLDEVNGPMYLPTPPAFNKSAILSVQFHIVSNTSAPVPYTNLCVSNLRVLMK